MTTRQRWTLLAVCVATFMLLLDITIVNVALPAIAKDLKSSFSDLQWVIDAYALSLAALLLTAGVLADRLGRRAVFAGGLAVFTIASLLCGLSTSPLLLELARALQGVGGAAMFATSLALLASSFQGPQRGTAFGIWGATTGAAVAIGPLIGGLLTEHIGWQSIFFINVPIGIAAIAVTLAKVQESTGPPARLDWPGFVTFSGGLFFLIFALVRGNAEGWGSTLIVSFIAAAVVLLAAFLVIEVRRRDPMLDLRLFRKPAFAGASIAAFALSASIFSMFLYLTLYLQNVLGFQPLDAGLRFLPTTLLSFAVAPLAGRLSEKVPVRFLMGGGLTLVGIGLLLMSGLDSASGWTALLAGFLFTGAGVGLTNPPLASTAIGVVPPERSGMGSGINSTFRQIGIATGIAAYGAIFQSSLASKLPGAPPGDVLAFARPGILGPGRREEFLSAYAQSLNELLVIGAVVAFAGGICALVLVRPRDFVAHGAPAAGEARDAGAPEPARA
jgi:EmrB/QacA subfamily drug resistance transporter